jgi:hypothetical protein
LIRYYNIFNYLVKLLYKKDIKNIISQSGGNENGPGVKAVKYLGYFIIHLILFLIFGIFYIIGAIVYIIMYKKNKQNGGGWGDSNNYSTLMIKGDVVIDDTICSFERINKLLCYKNYLNTPSFIGSMTNIKNFLIINMFMIKFLYNLFDVISKQGDELVRLKDILNENLFCSIIHYKIEFLNQTDTRSKIIYYKFSLNNKKTGNVYYFELTMNQIKRIFSLKDFSKIKYFMNDSFLHYVYNIIHKTKKNVINNKSSILGKILNKVITSRKNKRMSNNIDDVANMYKLLKRMFSNLLISINDDFNKLKRNSYYQITTIVKKKPEVFIGELVDDLCSKTTMSVDYKNIQINIRNMDKRIEENKNISGIS